jgi:hypothetical protein
MNQAPKEKTFLTVTPSDWISLDQQTPGEFMADWQQTRTDPKTGFLTLEMVQ